MRLSEGGNLHLADQGAVTVGQFAYHRIERALTIAAFKATRCAHLSGAVAVEHGPQVINPSKIIAAAADVDGANGA
jgi:hypothetical protein